MVALNRSIVPRALGSRVVSVLGHALRRLPPRVQRIGLLALGPAMKRWPTVLRILGLQPIDPSPPVRQEAPRRTNGAKNGASAAANVASAVIERWLRQLKSDPEASERVLAVRAVATSGAPGAGAALEAALRDPIAEVAAEAADALRNYADAGAIAALRRVVENADGFFAGAVRAAAIRTLSAVLPRGEGAPITAAVGDVDAEVSVAAIAGVVDRNESGGAEALMTVLENPRGFYVSLTRGAAARGLKSLALPPDPARLRALIDAEHDGDVRAILTGLVPAPSS